MNEILSNEINELFFYCRKRGALVEGSNPTAIAEIKRHDDVVIKQIDPVREDKGIYSVTISPDSLDGAIEVEVTFSSDIEGAGIFVQTQEFIVSRRLVSYDDVLKSVSDIPFDDYAEVERTVRGMIESYCRQPLTYFYGNRIVRGNESMIFLPQRMERFDLLEKQIKMLNLYSVSTEHDGYRLSDDGLTISNPQAIYYASAHYDNHKECDFLIKGQWGYRNLPDTFAQAALMLIKSRFCPDSVYRSRYLDNIRNEGMRLEFNDKAYEDSTGDPDADMILQKYRIVSTGVV